MDDDFLVSEKKSPPKRKLQPWEKRLDAALDIEDGLTEWEVDFLEDIAKRRDTNSRWNPTLRQVQILEEILDKKG